MRDEKAREAIRLLVEIVRQHSDVSDTSTTSGSQDEISVDQLTTDILALLEQE